MPDTHIMPPTKNGPILPCPMIVILTGRILSLTSCSKWVIPYRALVILRGDLSLKLRLGYSVCVFVPSGTSRSIVESLPVFWMILTPAFGSTSEAGFRCCALGVFVRHRFFSEAIITPPKQDVN